MKESDGTMSRCQLAIAKVATEGEKSSFFSEKLNCSNGYQNYIFAVEINLKIVLIDIFVLRIKFEILR